MRVGASIARNWTGHLKKDVNFGYTSLESWRERMNLLRTRHPIRRRRHRPSLGQCLDHLPSSERVGARGKTTHGAEGVKEHCA